MEEINIFDLPEEFEGTNKNPKKEEKVKDLQQLALEIASECPFVTAKLEDIEDNFLQDNTTVLIFKKQTHIKDEHTRIIISCMLIKADYFSVYSQSDGSVRMLFTITNLWEN